MPDTRPCLAIPLPAGVLIGILVLACGPLQRTLGQPTGAPPDSSEAWHEDAWTPILERDGLQISYIYYPDADNEHDGIVLRLVNDSQDTLRYAFTLIFRAPDAERKVAVQGRLGPGEMKTGDAAGLFWMPFREADRSIGEIGLRRLEIAPARSRPPDDSGRT
ncbi:MAG: hypothetical protein ABEK75_07980 [Salinibacter sp.]